MTALVHKRVEAGRMLRLSILPLLAILGGLLPQLTTSVPGRVEGMVVELGSGLPLADVWVTLGSDGNDRDILTDRAGRFVFADVPPGSYAITPELAGFVRPPTETVEGTRSVYVLPGRTVPEVVLYLMRGGVISGRVYADNREPVPGIRVRLLRRSYTGGVPSMALAESVESDDRGDYRLFGLAPGEYYLRADRNEAPSRSTGYPPTYYPNTTDPETAAPIRVTGGLEISGIDLSMSIAGTVTVGGRIISSLIEDTTGWARVSIPPITLVRAREGIIVPPLTIQNTSREPGRYLLRGVPVGSYEFLVSIHREQGPNYGRVHVEVGDQDIENADIIMTPGTNLAGRVRFPTGAPAPETSELLLRISGTGSTGAFFARGDRVSVEPDGSFVFAGLAPAEYLLRPASGLAGYYIRSARLGGEDVLYEPFDIAPGTERSLEIALANDGGTIVGTVVDERGKFVTDAVVVLLPLEWRGSNPYAELRMQPLGAGAGFVIEDVRPGRYALVAFEDGSRGYFDEPLSRRLLPFGERIEVAPNGRSSLRVPLVPESLTLDR